MRPFAIFKAREICKGIIDRLSQLSHVQISLSPTLFLWLKSDVRGLSLFLFDWGQMLEVYLLISSEGVSVKLLFMQHTAAYANYFPKPPIQHQERINN